MTSGVVQDCSQPWNWVAIMWMAASSSRPLWGWNVQMCRCSGVLLLGVLLYKVLKERPFFGHLITSWEN